MIQFDPSDPPWGECDGQLQSLGVSIRDQRKRRQMRTAVGAFSLAAVVVVATGLLYAPSNNAPAVTLKCREVIPLLASFEAGTLSDDLRQQVDAHLNICSHCREELKKLRDARTSDVQRDVTAPLVLVRKNRQVVALRTVLSRSAAF